MGLFNNYAKPGKGVEKDEKRPVGFVMFFVLLGRKFGSYVKLSLLYTLTCIPSIITMFFVISAFALNITALPQTDWEIFTLLSIALSIAVVMGFSLSPFSSGFYYILRNFAREEHSWLSDFWEIFKDNWKHSVLTWVIDSAIVIVSLISLRLYFIISYTNSMFLIPMMLMIIALIVFGLSAIYRWTSMVTFEGKLGQNYKNSIFFVLGNTWRSLAQFIFSTVWLVAVALGTFLFSLIGYIVVALIGFSIFGLIGAVSVYPVIAKYTNREQE